jgi:RNA polymerase sigma-70 factor (ECF subfamily)
VRELFIREATELSAYARSLPGTVACTAEDLVQTAFHEAIFAWRTVGPYAPDEQRRWLRRVLKNKAIDDYRKHRRVDVVDLATAAPEPGPPAVAASELAELSLTLANCWAEIRRMPPVRQQVAFLAWDEDWTTAQIAAHLGLSASTVRGHLYEARKQLRSSLGRLVIGDEDDDARSEERRA